MDRRLHCLQADVVFKRRNPKVTQEMAEGHRKRGKILLMIELHFPKIMQIEFFNSAGAVIRTVQNTGDSLSVNVYCRNGIWNVRSSSTGTLIPISQVSCAQSGSTGFDAGYIVGSATN
uniref:ASH domain-containing protein n=1 Tax=Heterorhabditis bacteriophora TaxID=37862 RepID=A0A1I7X8T3_HETBA